MKSHLIGSILIEKGYISPAEMELGLAHQKATNMRLGESLIDLGLITQDQLNDALAEKFSIPMVELHPGMLSDDLWQKIPAHFIRKYEIIPILEDGNTLHVVVADPTKTEFKEKLEKLTGYQIEISLGDEMLIRKYIQDYLSIQKDEADQTMANTGQVVIREAYRKGSSDILAFTHEASSGLFLKSRKGWEAIQGYPRRFSRWIRYRCGLSGDYHGRAWGLLQAGNTILPIYSFITPVSDGERIQTKLGKEMSKTEPFRIPFADRLKTVVEERGWVVFSGNDPWIEKLAVDLLPVSNKKLVGWFALTIPGVPIPEQVSRIETNGITLTQTLEALERIDMIQPDGIILDTPARLTDDFWMLLENINTSGCAVIQITNDWGPYVFHNSSIRHLDVRPIRIVTIARMGRICRSCAEPVVCPANLTIPVPGEASLHNAEGCSICRGGMLGSITFIEELAFDGENLTTLDGTLYPSPGARWNDFPDGTTPAECMNHLEMLFPEELFSVQRGWKISGA